ncbi:hypothetical protein GGS23DRAFT_596114 [Durotheca rogersii]|uniref:uncharacterized protein n=1 Tax=Durotheca rogersii TaxID=419775 RepID=UPI0022205750|nr:uncharacterized protein GGS23DRAFT_596114 [Durotheca rogersii]KAI5863603.1 hypothetical protein GGS23DRAFT_596114 [Durotheca rogersii]
MAGSKIISRIIIISFVFILFVSMAWSHPSTTLSDQDQASNTSLLHPVTAGSKDASNQAQGDKGVPFMGFVGQEQDAATPECVDTLDQRGNTPTSTSSARNLTRDSLKRKAVLAFVISITLILMAKA